MLKITLEIKEDETKENCKLTLKNPTQKQVDSATENEKVACANVQNAIIQAINELNTNKNN